MREDPTPLRATGILSGEVTSDPFEGWTDLRFRLDLEVTDGRPRGEITIANLSLPVRSWRQVAGTVVSSRLDDAGTGPPVPAGAGLVNLDDEAWFATVEHLDFGLAERGDARLVMHLELCRVTNTHRRLVLDGIVQIGVIRVSGGQRALASAAALVDLADFIPTADADTDVIVLRPKTDH